MPSDSIALSRETAAAPDEVWHVLTDLDSTADHLSAVTALEKLTDGPYRVGTRWRETRKVMGREQAQEMHVTSVEALGSTRIEAKAGNVEYVTTFELEPLHPGTRLTMRFDGVQPDDVGALQRAAWAVMAPIGLRLTRKMMQRDLDDIVAALET